MNILFICSKNQWRSPTGEEIYRRHAGLNVRSRGTASSARRRLCLDDVQWADLIFAMENKHKQRMLADYPAAMKFKSIQVLDIPDEYRFMDPELVTLIQTSVDPFLDS